jgi:tryptophanyl-tRNA synthetase
MRILSGMKPTGYLHLGNYVGALKNWVELQTEFDAFYMVADLHGLTSNQTEYKEQAKEYVYNMIVDWAAAGLDPKKSVLFLQSDIAEHSELFTLLSMITPVSWCERNPTFKEQKEELKGKDLDNLGFLGYPVLQTADIALYQAERVPVGKDQIPHLEISREIIRRFHFIYNTEVLKEPEPILGKVTKLNGLDGRKMSKSYDNAIFLRDDEETMRKKVMTMVTDVKRIKRTDIGHPDECNLFPYYLAFSSDQELIDGIRKDCESAAIGCVDCKKKLTETMKEYFTEFYKKRSELATQKDMVYDIMRDGAKRAGLAARETMELVREAIGMNSKNRYMG